MAFFEDPRLRQRWNQITQDAETVTENAAAGIFSFQQHYVNPCLESVAASVEQCTGLCLGDPEERRRRQRERERARAEYSFDFYDDWYEEEEQSGGLLGGWGGEDWDRLLAGTGSQRRHTGGETADQPRRKRGMSYGTRGGGRRKASGHDPTIIPSTQPIGFLSKLPWKMGGTLRYKPSAANLKEHPGKHGDAESQPLLGGSESPPAMGQVVVSRKRSGTTGSGDTSDSYRSRGDLFPSDGEGDEDAVPLDDEVTYDMVRKDDRSSGKTRSSKGKRPQLGGSRTISRTTISSVGSRDSHKFARMSTGSLPATPDVDDDDNNNHNDDHDHDDNNNNNASSLQDLDREEERLRQEEDEKIARKKAAATQLAAERGLGADSPELRSTPIGVDEPKPEVAGDEAYQPETPPESLPEPEEIDKSQGPQPRPGSSASPGDTSKPESKEFVPARLPHFG